MGENLVGSKTCSICGIKTTSIKTGWKHNEKKERVYFLRCNECAAKKKRQYHKNYARNNKNYYQRPEVKEKKRIYMREYMKNYEQKPRKIKGKSDRTGIRGETYQGRVCNLCGERKRYESNYACVKCQKETNKQNYAKHEGKTGTYKGKPCKKCGSRERYARNTYCVACIRRKNKGNYKKYPGMYKASNKKWVQNNRGKVNANNRKLRAANLARYRRQGRNRYWSDPEKHRKQHRRTARKSRANNPEWHRARHQRRRAQKLLVPADHIIDTNVFTKDKWICGICNKSVDPNLRHPDPMCVSLDHIIPLSKGGSHTYDNVQCTHLRCNLSKGSKYDGPNPDGSKRWKQLSIFEQGE